MSRNITEAGGIQVASNARALGHTTPRNPTRTFEIPVPVRECDSTIEAGFRVEWGRVDIDGDELEICSGAGMGSSWATISFRGKSYAISATDIVEAFLAAVAPEVLS